jgi:hypothetical protein
MRARTTAAVMVAVATLTSGAPSSGAPTGVGAAPTEASVVRPRLVAGDFTGDAREEVFVHRPGRAPDHLATFTDEDASAGHPIHAIETPFTVNGSYVPVAADVDGDDHDELLWYAPGSARDYLWDFTSDTAATSRPLTVNGDYTPVAGDFTGDGTDDVFWYGRGTAPDFLWDYDATGAHSSSRQTVNGDYVPIAGSYGTDATDDIFFYNRVVAGPDNLWDFRAGTTGHVNRAFQVTGTYRPYALDLRGEGAGGGDIFWYGPGAGPDSRWDFAGGRLASAVADPVSGRYDPVVSADLFADGADDVLWVGDVTSGGSRTVHLWDHDVQGTQLIRTRYQLSGESWPGISGLPAAPDVTAGAGGGSGEIAVRWDAVAGATGYRVVRAPTPGGSFSTVAAIDVTTGVATAVPEVTTIWSAGHSYVPPGPVLTSPDPSPWFEYIEVGGARERCFRVIARNAAGDGPASATACGSPP